MEILATVISSTAPGAPDPEKLAELLKYGQMGLAVAFLVIGGGLFTAAIAKKNLTDTFANVLALFGRIMIVLFLVSFAGAFISEMVAAYMNFDLRRHPTDQIVSATISLPPLNSNNYKQYGPIEILYVPSKGQKGPPRPANEPQQVEIVNGGMFYIDLDSLVSKLKSAENLAAMTQAKLGGAQPGSPAAVNPPTTSDPAQ